MNTTTTHKFDEQGKAEYAEEIHRRWEAGVLETGEAVYLLAILEYVDEDGIIPTWITEEWEGAEGVTG
ncbi:hypothetical protein [Brachybacterium kimchii]|uniref:Uncharacterized protein n=1 Tax=Brachybacterium kimchii TaxID=2942909 RepID=A0ABY4N655_9MICO|nr:hypothetical protein [Brachybacterium kimchii]UQN29581.1 hypothetical protein M4486_18430 [Brachybacterium kimchii]